MKSFLCLLLYRLIIFLLLPVVLLLLIVRSKNNPLYRQRLAERLGFLPKHFQKGGIVVHAASVGEVLALKPFVEKLLVAIPELPVTFTTFTPTGSAQVEKLFGQRVQHCYFPLDIYFCSKWFLKALAPKAMVFMETELWPNTIALAKQQQCRLLLVNGRLSAHSIKSYQKLAWLITPAVQSFDYIYTQSQENLDNYLALGAKPLASSVSGNLKYDLSVNDEVLNKQMELSQFLPFDRKLWMIASTHSGDEKIALAAHQQLLKQYPDLLLVIVPRHPERFEQVVKLAKNQHFSVGQRSLKQSVTSDDQVWVLDSLGELMAMFSLASIVVMGGSFSTIGGHNPLEPALFKKPIIVGSDMSNFNEIMQQLTQVDGIIALNNEQSAIEQLVSHVSALIENEHRGVTLGQNAYQVITANQGASDKSVEKLQHLVNSAVI
ncbi:lipid IV(A) 3-deoxy-D-manno-octulosonic acid transferase [Thalassotalea sp. PLHSN55]|uniref:lipid IV(A) 3-deoxy-D-manno-octulosonic acid transferase n=1 Tax=Thalassotalea sp. PLHSN55 TaxID=3435888 RepID=UPI003F845D28